MAITGDLSRWANRFPDTLVPRILRLLLDSWANFNTVQTHEVPITQGFFVVLEKNQEFSRLPFLIDLEVVLLNEDGTGQRGRMDIRFIHGYRRRVYFSIECKRLRVTRPAGFHSLAREYVTEGMSRYFTGQYAADLDKAGMLGYVMDGNVSKAIYNVRQAIEKRRSDLCMSDDETLRCSSSISSPQVKESYHCYGPDNRFIIYHVFLPL